MEPDDFEKNGGRVWGFRCNRSSDGDVGGASVGLNLGQNERRYYVECVGDRS